MMTVDIEAIHYINSLVNRAEVAENKLDELKKEYAVYIKKMKEDLAEYERVANDIWDITKPYECDETPLGDFAEKIQGHILVILKGRERPEWTFDRVARERDEALAEVEKLQKRLEEEAKDYTQDDVNKITQEMITVRKEHEASAFQRGAEFMRDASERACLEVARSESYYSPNVGDECAERVRSILIPDYRSITTPSTNVHIEDECDYCRGKGVYTIDGIEHRCFCEDQNEN